jgi:hypothetical protein
VQSAKLVVEAAHKISEKKKETLKKKREAAAHKIS